MRNLELWHSVALNSEIIRRTKKLTRERKLPLLVLQRLSQECHSTVRLLGCRLVSVRYLFDTRQPFSFDDFEGKWSLNGTFFRYLPRHFSRRHRFKCHDHIWRKDSWTGVWFCGQKKTRAGDSSHFAPTHPKYFSTLSPLDLCMSAKFDPDRLRFAEVIPERLFFSDPEIVTI